MYKYKEKKRLMFLSGEDFYFLSFNILLILDCLGCSNNKIFRDHRKLSFLINFVSDANLLKVLSRNIGSEIKNQSDKEYLFDSYSNAILKKNEITKILMTLENKGYVNLERGTKTGAMDIQLNKNNTPDKFLDKKLFNVEYRNCNEIKSVISRLNTLTLETMLDKIYYSHGIKKWAF